MCVAWTGGDDDDLVLAAFHLMKLLAISESPGGGHDHDPARLRNQLVELQATVEGFNELEKQVGNADRSVARIREVASSLRAELVRRLGELSSTVQLPLERPQAMDDRPAVTA